MAQVATPTEILELREEIGSRKIAGGSRLVSPASVVMHSSVFGMGFLVEAVYRAIMLSVSGVINPLRRKQLFTILSSPLFMIGGLFRAVLFMESFLVFQHLWAIGGVELTRVILRSLTGAVVIGGPLFMNAVFAFGAKAKLGFCMFMELFKRENPETGSAGFFGYEKCFHSLILSQ